MRLRPLAALSEPESVLLLRRHLTAGDAPPPRMDATADELRHIAAALGELPLALRLAGRYLRRYRRETVAGYLAALARPNLLAHPSLAPEEGGVARAFALSLARLEPTARPADAAAVALLARAAALAPGEPLAGELLLATYPTDPPTRADDGLERLLELGLLEAIGGAAGGGEQYRLHRLLAAFAAGALAGEMAAAQEGVERVVQAIFDQVWETKDPRALRLAIVHLSHVVDKASAREDTSSLTLINDLGLCLRLSGDLAGARPYHERALAISERVLGPEHPDTAGSLNNLGALLQAQGDLAGARPYYERALAIRERVLGPEHPDTAQSLNNLGGLLDALDEDEEALDYYRRALAIRERVLGAEHPDTAGSLHNVGALLFELGRPAEARPLLARALAIYMAKLGPDHPNTRNTAGWLAALP